MSGSMKPLGQVYMTGITRVADLLTSDEKNWATERLKAMFTAGDIHDIKQIAVGGPGTEDYLA